MSLSAGEVEALRAVVGTMIPADAGLGLPGADDPAILADIVKSIGRDLPLVREALAEIAARDRGDREAAINDYYRQGSAAAALLGRLVLGAYYRDDRVLLALGLEARAPFPKGHLVEQGEWALLEAVKSRAPFWRDNR